MGLKLEAEPAPAHADAAAPKESSGEDAEPSIWVPPAHVLASCSEDSEHADITATGRKRRARCAGEDSVEDEFDWGADADAAAQECAPAVVRQPRVGRPRGATRAKKTHLQ